MVGRNMCDVTVCIELMYIQYTVYIFIVLTLVSASFVILYNETTNAQFIILLLIVDILT